MNVYFLIDRSGSMSDLWVEAIGAVNAYANKVTEARKYVAVFDNTSYDVLRKLTADKWVDIDPKEAHPRGTTPLYDAAGRLLDQVFSDKPEKAIIVIMTDGYENASTEYSQATIKARLADAEKLNWQVVFLGANFDTIASETAKLGMRSNRSVPVSKGSLYEMSDMLAGKSSVYYATGTAASMDFSDAEIQSLSGTTTNLSANTPVSITTVDWTNTPLTVESLSVVEPTPTKKTRAPRKKKTQ